MAKNVENLQRFLTAQGFNPGPIDGVWGQRTAAAWNHHRNSQNVKQVTAAENAGFPRERYNQLVEYFGTPTEAEMHLVKVEFPWECYLYDGPKRIQHASVHDLISSQVRRVFKDLWDLAGKNQKVVEDWGMCFYFGCYNNRSIRGGVATSLHAWGAALDFDANRNSNYTHREQAWMPEEVIDAWEIHGFRSGGHAWNRDFMHFQATK